MALKLEASASLDSTQFQAGLRKMESGVHSLGHTLKNYVAGAIGLMSFESAFEKTLHSVKEYINESKRMGVSVEMVQVLGKAAKGAGLEIDAVAAAMERLNALRAKALSGGQGSDKALQSFKSLGVSKEDLQTKNAQEIMFGAIRQKILSVNPQEIALPLREIFGKSGGQLIPFLSKNIEEIAKKMKEHGQLLSTSTAYQLKALDAQTKAFGNIIMVNLAPALVKLGEAVLYLMGHIKSLATFLGGLTSGLTPKKLMEGISPKDLLNPAGLSAKFLKNVFGGISLQAGQNAMSDPDEFLKKFRAETAEQIDHANEQTKEINFDEMANQDVKEKKLGQSLQPDELIKSGNFAFSLRSTISAADQKQIDLLTQIARNTGAFANYESGGGQGGGMAFRDEEFPD